MSKSKKKPTLKVYLVSHKATPEQHITAENDYPQGKKTELLILSTNKAFARLCAIATLGEGDTKISRVPILPEFGQVMKMDNKIMAAGVKSKWQERLEGVQKINEEKGTSRHPGFDH